MNKIDKMVVVAPINYDGVVFGYMGVRDSITDQAFWGRSYNVKELRRQDENCDLIFWAK